jgi:hypothetical protein
MSADFVTSVLSTRYLGKEFLTWLWFRSDRDEGLIKAGSDGPTVQVWFVDKVVLSGSSEGSDRIAIRTTEPSGSEEARTALRQGKQLEQARLTFVSDQREWTATINGEQLAVGSIKLPAILTREEDDQISERLYLLDTLDSHIGGLFKHFLALRMDSEQWAGEKEGITTWIRSNPR